MTSLFERESPANLIAARILLAGTALWMLLSRPGLAGVLDFPAPMWSSVSFERRLRFFYVLPSAAEQVLFIAIHITLVAVLIGVYPRLMAFISALLLYHFAPLETILWTPNPYLRGFTIPILGLLVLSFAPRERPVRWPLLLIQIFFVQIYFFAGYAKLFTSGLRWLEAENIRHYLILMNQYLGFPRTSLAFTVAGYGWMCALIAWTGMIFDLAFPIVLFSRRARYVMVPLALFFHVANAILFRVVFQNTVLLLLFVNWEWVVSRVRQMRPAPAEPLATGAR